ncbi:MAG: 6-carboxyhexanoate--CoA ligase [Candidatus Magnetominusculus sp. LBB02]|nr:6-carboxyhexanoate--CoA ligase [Candidatus Magnetominusculus sp. LBB02]
MRSEPATFYSIRMRASQAGRHISGAEGIYNEALIDGTSSALIHRALGHSRGKPDSITLTIEKIDEGQIIKIPALPICTCRVEDEDQAAAAVHALLSRAGIGAASTAMSIITDRKQLSGAALVDAATGERLDRENSGVRITRFGIEEAALEEFMAAIEAASLQSSRVLEAVMIASKAASCEAAAAELCISDNPDYTTGYVSSRRFGYIRVPHIKKEGDLRGGRVVFINKGADIDAVVRYMRQTPVMIDKFSGISGRVRELHALIGTDNS